MEICIQERIYRVEISFFIKPTENFIETSELLWSGESAYLSVDNIRYPYRSADARNFPDYTYVPIFGKLSFNIHERQNMIIITIISFWYWSKQIFIYLLCKR